MSRSGRTGRAWSWAPARVVLVGALGLALAACGAGGGSDTDATPASPGGADATDTAATTDADEAATAAREQAMAAAREEVATLTTRQLAAQLVVPDAGTADAGVAAIREGYGGLIVMRGALPEGEAAADAAREANERYAEAMRESGRDWPAFLSIDQEGGPVTRIDAPLTEFPAAMALGATGDADAATAVGAASGSELVGLGFTVVFAPVMDVTTPQDPTIGVRSPGGDPALVSATALGYVEGYREAGIVPVVKHFPGHGGVAADTHEGTAVLEKSREELAATDLVPFQDAVDARVPAVMTAHLVAEAVDDSRPASLSAPVTTGLLREELGYDGLVVTDALNMGAVTEGTAPGEASVRAIEAGADIALMPADPAAAVTAIEEAVTEGRLTRDRLEESATRMIVALRTRGEGTPAEPGSHEDVAREVAAASITQVDGTCGARQVEQAVTVSGGTQTDRERFTQAATARGLRVGGADATSVVLLGGGGYQAGDGSGSGGATGSGDVLVALDAPYGLAEGSAAARFAVYGRTPATFEALLDVLLGEASAPGALPVAVGSWPIGAGCD